MTGTETPWRDESLLQELYGEQKLSTNEIADELGCHQATVWEWMDRFEISRRSAYEAATNRRLHPAVFIDRGYVVCASNYRGASDSVGIHRLVMVAEHGFDAVAGKHAHHRNGVRFDNRPENLEVGYCGSGPAQLALGLLLDYTGDEDVALAQYTEFKNEVVSQLECTGPDGRWRLTGRDIDAVLRKTADEAVAPSL